MPTLAGLLFFFSQVGQPYRLFGWLYLTVLAVLLITQGKPYYLAPAYPVLFAGGVVLITQRLEKHGQERLYPAIIAGLLIGGAVTAPMALPILPLETSDRMIGHLFGFVIDDPAMLTGEVHEQYGWQEQVATMAEIYHQLSPAEQAQTTILTGKYNQASAVNFFGNPYGLPQAVSGPMTYFLWGPQPANPQVIIAYDIPLAKLEPLCSELAVAGTTYHLLAPVYNNNLPVYVCRAPRVSLAQAWPEFKLYDHLSPTDNP